VCNGVKLAGLVYCTEDDYKADSWSVAVRIWKRGVVEIRSAGVSVWGKHVESKK
jgi:hypothetical protein